MGVRDVSVITVNILSRCYIGIGITKEGAFRYLILAISLFSLKLTS